MAGGTELRCRGADHGVIGEAKEWKGDNYTYDNENDRFDKLFHGCVPAAGFWVLIPWPWSYSGDSLEVILLDQGFHAPGSYSDPFEALSYIVRWCV